MRKKDWQRHFWAEIDRQRSLPFEYGQRDCVLCAARIADAITVDGRYRERTLQAFSWTDEREALRLIAGGLQPLVESILGPMVPWMRLTMGDLVLIVDDKDRECVAVHDGAQVIAPDSVGMRSIPFRCVKGGWRVE